MKSDDVELGFGSWALGSLVLLVLPFFGFVLASQAGGWIGAFGICGLIFLSAATVGALLGFVFSVPRVIARETSPAEGRGAGTRILSTNTNLERISDWLSTMLIGVGLSQLTNLNDVFFRFRGFLEQTATVYTVDGQATAGVIPLVGPFVLILGAASGFLFMYLMTRLVLVGFFRDSEEMLGGVAVAAIRVAVNQAQAVQEPSPLDEVEGPNPGGAEKRLVPEIEGGDEGSVRIQNPGTAATFSKASQAKTLSTDEALEVMFELLYEPGGYRRVIQMSGELSRTRITKRADYWFYLASAFGQQMQHSDEGSDERQSARDNALDAARRSVRIDATFRARLRLISNSEGMDDDLSLLRDDPEFRSLVKS